MSEDSDSTGDSSSGDAFDGSPLEDAPDAESQKGYDGDSDSSSSDDS
ncbi:hypothetical protein ACLI4Z_15915 [Natrialbaceae archaeon A-arb3/5]